MLTTKYSPHSLKELCSHLKGLSCFVNTFLIIKPTRCIKFSNLFWNETLHVSDNSSVLHQEFFTVNTAMVYVIQLASRIRMELQFHSDPARKLSTNLYDMPLLCLQ